MASLQFNINQAFEDVFNIYAQIPAFPLANKRAGGTGPLPAFNVQVEAGENPFRFDLVAQTGIVVWDRVIVDYTAGGVLQQYNFPVECLMEAKAPKIIEKTTMPGRKGSVKEYITQGDYEITLRGFLVDYENDVYPAERVQELNAVFEDNTALVVKSRYLNGLGIFNVVIQDIKWPVMEGYANCQPFEIQLLSDEPIELELQDV
ncbi:MAG: hypothetical protein F9K23_00685 [Bacteroidetes bacterium]|nr:MAG: hypothetical protein F9K23_00685 [Bacteroidota bacterium]